MSAIPRAAPASRLHYVILRAIDLTLWALQVLTGLLFLVFGANKFNGGVRILDLDFRKSWGEFLDRGVHKNRNWSVVPVFYWRIGNGLWDLVVHSANSRDSRGPARLHHGWK